MGWILEYLRNRKLIYLLISSYFLLLTLNAIGVMHWTPPCLISATTGYECFGCGLNTAAIRLLKGDFLGAWTANPLLFLYILLILVWIGYDFYKFKRQSNLNSK